MRVLVLGAGGMAGHVVSVHLRELGHVVDTMSASRRLDEKTVLVDASDQAAFESFVVSGTWDVVVNCIGVLVQESERQPALAAYLNGYLPHQLEQLFADRPTKLIHLSTDCVFSGENPPYAEGSPYDGQLFYDRAKALGEVTNAKDLTLRMSIIGPDMKRDGTGLFNWFWHQTGEISGYTNAMWNGVTTVELARGIAAAIDQNLTGLYHLVPDENISKFELLRMFVETFGRDDVVVLPDDRAAPDKTLVNTRTDFNHAVPSMREMVESMRGWVEAHPDLYPHYVRLGELA